MHFLLTVFTCFLLGVLSCSLVCLPDSTYNMTVLLGDDVELKCTFPDRSRLEYIGWQMGHDESIISCRMNSCYESESLVLIQQEGNYTSVFRKANINLTNNDQYTCDIHTLHCVRKCIINLIVHAPLEGLIFINNIDDSAINTTYLRVLADANTSISCQTNSSVKPLVSLEWIASGHLPLYEHPDMYDPHHIVSSRISFKPTTEDNGTVLTCEARHYLGTQEESIQTSITLLTEVCISHLEILNCDPLDAILNGQTSLSCSTNVSDINLVSSSVCFNETPVDITQETRALTSWHHFETSYAATYEIAAFTSYQVTCCVSSTSLCQAVCSDVCFFDTSDYVPIVTSIPDHDGLPLEEGSNKLRLECSSPPPILNVSFYWTKGTGVKQLVPSRYLNGSEVIEFEKLNREISGIYTCHMNTSNGIVLQSEISVVIYYRPRILNPEITIDPYGNDILILQCKADAFPEANVSWILPAAIMSTANKSLYREIGNGTLEISPPLSNSIRGENITCRAANQVGNDTFAILIPSQSSSAYQGSVIPLYAAGGGTLLFFLVVISLVIIIRRRNRVKRKANAEEVTTAVSTTQPTGQNRGALPPIPTDQPIANPATLHVSERQLPSRTEVRTRDHIPLRTLVHPLDEIPDRGELLSTRIVGSNTTANMTNSTEAKKEGPLDSSMEYATVCEDNKGTRQDAHVTTSMGRHRVPLDPSAEYATVDKKSNRPPNLGSSSTQMREPLDPSVEYATVDKKCNVPQHPSLSSARHGPLDSLLEEYATVCNKKNKDTKQEAHMTISLGQQRGPLDPTVEYGTVDKKRNMPSNPRFSSSAQRVPLDPSVEYATVDKKSNMPPNPGSSSAQKAPLDPSVEYATVDKKSNRPPNLGSSAAQAEYAVVDTTRKERKKGRSKVPRSKAPNNPDIEYAVVDKSTKSRHN